MIAKNMNTFEGRDFKVFLITELQVPKWQCSKGLLIDITAGTKLRIPGWVYFTIYDH